MVRLLYLLTIAFLFSSCGGSSSGEPQAFSIKANINISDFEFKSDKEELVLGVFSEEESNVPLYKKTLTKAASNITIGAIPAGNYYVRLSVFESSRFKTTLVNYGQQSLQKDLVLTNKTVQLISFNRIKQQILDRCTACHGNAAGQIAAELDLRSDVAYANLVNVASTFSSEKKRVVPNSVDNSFLPQVMRRYNLPFAHTGSPISTASDIELVENWIKNGALKN